MTSFRGIVCIWTAGALWALFAPVSGWAADGIDAIMDKTEMQIPLKKGMAIGFITGRQGDDIQILNKGIPFSVSIYQLQNTAEDYLTDAERLVSEGWFHRAALQLGMARLLDPGHPKLGALEAQILGGLNEELIDRRDFRVERERSQTEEFRKKTLTVAATVFPHLVEHLKKTRPGLPCEKIASLANVDGWSTPGRLEEDNFRQYKTGRNPMIPPQERLRTLDLLLQALPPVEESKEKTESRESRPRGAIQSFLRAAGGLWLDQVGFTEFKRQFEGRARERRDPTESAVAAARIALREKLMPTYQVRLVREANLFKQVQVLATYTDEMVEELQPRLNAPFIEQTRKGSGFSFLTSAGDEVFVPLEDLGISSWEEFDRAKTFDAGNSEQEFLTSERAGMKQFDMAADALILAWGKYPQDQEVNEALRLLQEELVTVFNGAPLNMSDSVPVSTFGGSFGFPAPAPAPLTPGQVGAPNADPFGSTFSPPAPTPTPAAPPGDALNPFN